MINRVDTSTPITRRSPGNYWRKPHGRRRDAVLGSEGIRLLAYTLQNELIAQGYIHLAD
ncbi:hypothetical protein LNQ03_04285 [Klebsiella pneumoniae subsp. pneumoniae]|nr:hypothetical protein [Klebsiella pneumoniae subsp. pneumoniae]